MPVTRVLSKLFYERLGEEITNELVDWFNQVDSTYRSELREINELNFARFDDRLKQQAAAFESKLEERIASLEARLGARIDTKLDAAVAQHAFAQLDAKIDRSFAEARTALEKGLKEQTRWMFVAWSTLLIPIIGLWLRR